ncbi:MAG: class F sortase [Sporichthyaceae bacterium]
MIDPTPASPVPRGGRRWPWALLLAGCATALGFTAASWWPRAADAAASNPPSVLATVPDPNAAATDWLLSFLQSTQATDAEAGPDEAGDAPSPPGAPRVLAIPSLGVSAAVDAVGTGSDGALQLPAEPTRLGWYGAGARPGDAAGSAVLAGHLDRPGGELGPLAELSRVRTGAQIVVTDDAGISRTFHVRSIEVVERESLYLANAFRTDGEGVLTLITCTGRFDRDRGVYPSNLVVVAVPTAPATP